jgi:diacylglycerol kinase family enzyme
LDEAPGLHRGDRAPYAQHRRPSAFRVCTVSQGVKARLAALAALGAAVLAAAVLVAMLFTSLLAVAAAAALLVVAGGCAWIALTRSGLARMFGLAAAVLAIAASATALYLGGAGKGVAAFLAAIALFTVAARSAGRRSLRSRPSAVRGTSAPARDAGRPRAVLLMNPRSGGGKVERFHLAQEAKRRGIETIELGPGDDLRRLAVDAVASADAIGMAGGDGSQALVADVAMRHNVPYVCVPAGTRNHLALDLGLDRDDVVGALDGFVDGVAHRIDVGLVNGRLFVNNVSLGVYAEAVRSDAYRDAKLATMERTLPELLGPGATPMDLRFTDAEGKLHETAQLLMVSNNPYRIDDLTGGSSRPRLDTGMLGILAVEITSSAQAAELLALEAIGRARNSGGWLEWSAPTLVVDSSSQIAAGIDGESMMLEPPLRFEIVPQALTVLLPPSAIGVSPAGLSQGLSLSAVRELWGEVRGGTP